MRKESEPATKTGAFARASAIALAAVCALSASPARAQSNAAGHQPGRNQPDPAFSANYTLSASLNPSSHTIAGKGTITFSNGSTTTLRDVWLHLYLNAFKNGQSRFLREPIGAFRGGGGVRDWGAIDVSHFSQEGVDLWPRAELRNGSDLDETDVRVPLAHPIPPGEHVTFEIEWTSKLPSVVERTGYDGSYHFAGQWFPKIAKLEPDGTFAHFPFTHLTEFYADYGAYDVTIDVPQGFAIGATGPAIESRDENGRHFERHVQKDIHDFAFTAWDQFEKFERKIGPVAVTLLAPRHMKDTADRELDAIAYALPYFDRKYGDYPYSVLTVVHPPDRARETGGMEYPTLITTGGPFYLPRGFLIGEEVTVHELGHQWFYGLVGTNENKYPFLDEGMNSFAEQDELAHAFGDGSTVNLLDLTLADNAVMAVSSRLAVHDEKVSTSSDAFFTGFDYGRLVYGRTATIFETIRRTWGDAPSDDAIGGYTRDYRFEHPTPKDLLEEVRVHVGEEAREFAHVALDEKGWVDFVAVSADSQHEGTPAGMYDRDGKRETTTATSVPSHWVGSALIARRGTLVLPVDIELVDAAGGKRRVRWDGRSDHHRIQYAGSEPLAYVVVDPDHAVLVDQSYVNNHAATAEASHPGAPRSFERAFFWAETLVFGATP